MELPTIAKEQCVAVRFAGQVQRVETEAEAKEVAFEIALNEAIGAWLSDPDVKPTREDLDDGRLFSIEAVMELLLANRNDLTRICKLRNGGNTVPVTAPPRAETPLPDGAEPLALTDQSSAA